MALVDLRRSFIKRTASFRKKRNQHNFLKADKITDLTEEDREKFLEFKGIVFNDLKERHTDNVLLRFLKARSFLVDEAVKLFRLDITFRRILEVENIPDFVVPEVYEKYEVTGIIGFDKEGSIVRVLNVGSADIRGHVHCLSSFELLKILVWFIEEDLQAMAKENKKKGCKEDKITYIVNLENISFHQIMYKPAIDNCMQGLKILQDHFYDVVKVAYVVNVPSFFATFYNILRPVIQENLHRLIKILPDNWRDELLKHINADVLPSYLGGKRVGCHNDPFCKSFIRFGGTIPQRYYPAPDAFLKPDDPDVLMAAIQPGSFVSFRYPVFEEGTLITFHVTSKDNDIGIGLFYDPLSWTNQDPATNEKKEVLYTNQRKEAPCTNQKEDPYTNHKKDPVTNDKKEGLYTNQRKEAPCTNQKKKVDVRTMEPLIPVIRSQCQIAPEVHTVVAWRPGVYVLHFDNTYSWMNSKRVLFKVKLQPPEMKEIIV